MKILITLFLCFVVTSVSAQQFEVYFSPNGGCTNAVVNQLATAKKTILVQAYSFTSIPIAEALVKAEKRGIKVNVVLDRSNTSTKYSVATTLFKSGVKVKIDSKHAIAHNKIIIIDDDCVITGSFNFTSNAEKSNAENLLVIHSKSLVDKYKVNWELHEKHSETFKPAGEGLIVGVAFFINSNLKSFLVTARF